MVVFGAVDFNRSISSLSSRINFSVGDSFTTARVLIVFARSAKRRVLNLKQSWVVVYLEPNLNVSS